MSTQIKVKKIHPNAVVPTFKHIGDAGRDLHACLDADLYIPAETTVLVPTGLVFEIPEGYEIQIRSRSGLSLKGIVVVNSPGTVDSSFKGPVQVILRNLNKDAFVVRNGDRIAQMVVAAVAPSNLVELAPQENLQETSRNTQGFGSSGI